MNNNDNGIQLLEELMACYGDYLKKTAYLYLGDIQIAEDMVQETFTNFYKNYYRFNHKSSFKTYLYRILMNNCKMYIRKNSKKVMMRINDQEASFEENIINQQYLSGIIRALDPKSREVIILYYYNEWRVEEISDILKISQSAVKMRLKRARKKLEKDIVKEDCYEG